MALLRHRFVLLLVGWGYFSLWARTMALLSSTLPDGMQWSRDHTRFLLHASHRSCCSSPPPHRPFSLALELRPLTRIRTPMPQYSQMSLWAIAQSPLMFGADSVPRTHTWSLRAELCCLYHLLAAHTILLHAYCCMLTAACSPAQSPRNLQRPRAHNHHCEWTL